jgi:hypothetical protein
VKGFRVKRFRVWVYNLGYMEKGKGKRVGFAAQDFWVRLLTFGVKGLILKFRV